MGLLACCLADENSGCPLPTRVLKAAGLTDCVAAASSTIMGSALSSSTSSTPPASDWPVRASQIATPTLAICREETSL